MTHDQLAQVGYEANQAYSASLGEHNPPWVAAEGADRHLWRLAAHHLVNSPDCSDEELHLLWLAGELRLGWAYGPVLDNAAKRHPHLVPWGRLPDPQRRKVSMFRAIVNALVR